ncbi:MAG TPA: PDGLE domain-containing protein [Nocardioidaceae bacterium]|nr:PDGLE domain-containing protein [Nocardioidaceae bacterium]
MRIRTVLVVGILAALLVAGGVSYYASSHPDGLEYVAEQVGFSDAAKDPATADSPLADYQVKGVENDALSGALAGVAGSLIVLALVTGLAYVVRRRGSTDRAEANARPRADEHPVDEQSPADWVDADEHPTDEHPRKGG